MNKLFSLYLFVLCFSHTIGQNSFDYKSWDETIDFLQEQERQLGTFEVEEIGGSNSNKKKFTERTISINDRLPFGGGTALKAMEEQILVQEQVNFSFGGNSVNELLVGNLNQLIEAKYYTLPELCIKLIFETKSVSRWEQGDDGDWSKDKYETQDFIYLDFCTAKKQDKICEAAPFDQNSPTFQNTLKAFQRIVELNQEFDKQVQADIDQALESFYNLNLGKDSDSEQANSPEPNVEDYDFYKKSAVLSEYGFSEANDLFYVGDNQNINFEISGGRYILKNKTGTQYWTKFITHEKGTSGMALTPDILDGNFDVELKFQVTDRIAGVNSAFGLVIGAEWWEKRTITQFNRLTVTNNSNYAVQNYQNGKWTNLKKWTPYPSLNIDEDVILTFRKYDDICYYFINQVLVYQHPFEGFAGENFGINFSPGSTVSIDYFGFYTFD